MKFDFDVIVVGAGHAGCEAASASANLGCSTLLITMDMNKIAQMSCNPAVGGIAKGQIVREIDALGGQMGRITDRSSVQFRMLNLSKGPAVWSPRSQADRHRFMEEWRKTLDRTSNLWIWQDSVISLDVERGKVEGIRTQLGMSFRAPKVILTNGTFLNGMMHFGSTQIAGGRISEPASYGLSDQLRELGFNVQRMKTGTPVRIDGRSIDFSLSEKHTGEIDSHRFSYFYQEPRLLKQVDCYMVYTNEKVHDILRSSLHESPLFNGQIESIGPRYCPSIETKIVNFADKSRHQLFIEPEGEETEEYYLNGFSSSLPIDIQIRALKEIPAFRNVQVYRPGYAIEYDFFDPTQLLHTLESKLMDGLYLAGQVNGTTGYEEAAGQGLMAGINAALSVQGREPFVLSRDQAYIGVLIDDLVTKGVDEPYRMFTSRAEYRILLRQDDADHRLTKLSYSIGLASKERYEACLRKYEERDLLVKYIRNKSVKPSDVNELLLLLDLSPLKQGVKLVDLVLRPQVSIRLLATVLPELSERIEAVSAYVEEVVESAEILLKYQGYIDRERLNADKLNRLESLRIRGILDYTSIRSLSTEAMQKLQKIDPETIGQAKRIPGISPSDINILLVMLGR